MYYVARGSIPRQRHTQHRAADGSLYAEELFGVEGFTGRSSLLYHLTPPTRTHRIEPVARISLEAADDGLHRHRLTKTAAIEPSGDVVSGRIPLFFNRDVVFGRRPAGRTRCRTGTFYRNGDADEMLFVHEGTGVCDTIFGPLRYGPGDYLVLPIGTTWRLDPDAGSEQRMLYLEARRRSSRRSATATTTASCSSTRRTAQRDIHAPRGPRAARRTRASSSSTSDRATGSRPTTTATIRSTSSAGTATSGRSAFNIADFQPITGRVHQPPPVHQTFQARNFVVCSFVPRKFDYHPLAIPAPYNHSNINSDEVIYYVAGNFMSRRGVEIASFTLHPAGIPHGPHPGTAEASIGKEATEELAVMVDTFHPLAASPARPPSSTTPATRTPGCRRRTPGEEASELAERGPEAFPD